MSFITSAGLVSYINSLNLSGPNNVIPVAAFTAIGAATSIDAALVPKGNGALMATVPDNGVTGGNKRGNNAVDWQVQRNVNNQVASGAYSVIGGGQINLSSGQWSVVAGGQNNSASSDNATVGGGAANGANAVGATIPGGFAATARGVKGAYAYGGNASNNLANQGFSQIRDIVYRSSTADATATPLTVDNAGIVAVNNVAVMSAKQSASFLGQVIAVNTTTDEIHAWQVSGLIKRPSNAASVVLVNSTVTDLGSDAGAAAWTVALAADVTVGGLRVTITGAAATPINWVGSIRFTEVQKP